MNKLLFLAPQPFFQERGTPIAVRLALTVIAKRSSAEIDLLTYHEGSNVTIPGVTIQRINPPRWLSGIRPGISIKKLLCDVWFLFKALRLVHQARKDQYTMVHAVEESVFIACLIKKIYGIPFIYDMDSSLALQVSEKWFILKPLRPLLEFLEKYAVGSSAAVVPVCDALATIAVKHGSKNTKILYDISLLNLEESSPQSSEDLRVLCELKPEDQIVLYIGNLESYQGIDLLIESFAKAVHEVPSAHLVIIGGAPEHIEFYKRKATSLGITSRVHLIGPRPVSDLNSYLMQATILTSPRVKGNNTPMKVYSYLHSGIPLLATDLPTHTQVLDSTIAKLAPATPQEFARALIELLTSTSERISIGKRAFQRAEENFTFDVFERRLNEIYDLLI